MLDVILSSDAMPGGADPLRWRKSRVSGALGYEPVVPADAYAGWVDLVARIQTCETDGMEELYALFSRGIRF